MNTSPVHWLQWFPLHMVWHLVVAAGLGWWIARRTGRPALGWVCAGISIFIDLDHVLDYVRCFGWSHISWHDFVTGAYVRETGRVYLFGHAWEWVAGLWLVSRWIPQRAVAVALALGLAGHLAVDMIDHREYPGKNFFTYRALHHFEATAILTPRNQRLLWGQVPWDRPTGASPATAHLRPASVLLESFE